jgi:hypothetical protein
MSAGQRIVCFGGSAVAIEYSGVRAAAVVAFLFQHAPGEGDVPPHVTFRAVSDEQSEGLALYRDETLVYTGNCQATWAELLLGETCHHLADRSRGGLLFHAAALVSHKDTRTVWQGRGLLLPGGIGAGKSTLSAWLASRGWDYLTDELVFVPHGSDRMQAFVRPLNLKSTSLPVLRDCVDFQGRADHVLSGPQSTLLAPQAFHSTVAASEQPVSLIVFPRYRAGADFAWRPLAKAQGGLELMQCLINARNLPDYGLAEIARLARLAPAFRMDYAGFEQIEAAIGNPVPETFRVFKTLKV